MFHKPRLLTLGFCTQLFGLGILLAGIVSGSGAVTVTPPNSTTAPVVFTFDLVVDTSVDFSAVFMDMTSYPPAIYFTDDSWSAGDTVLTCTPRTAWPSAPKSVTYFLNGDDMDGFPVYETGSFTVSGGSGGGTGTNQITSFTLGVTHAYNQTSAGAPTLDPDAPFVFGNIVVLASNRTANSVSLSLPTGLTESLFRNPMAAEQFSYTDTSTDSNSFNAFYPAGTYTNTIMATASNQAVRLVLTNLSAQPPVPHVTNYTAAQNINASQPFTVGWDTFTGGTTNDFIQLGIGTNFQSPCYSMPGMLRGTSNSVVIPAGTLQPGSNYTAMLGFYRMIFITNNPGYASSSFRATITEFNLQTAGAQGNAAVLTNVVWSAGLCSFDVVATVGNTVTVQWSTNLPNWNNLLVTNTTASRFRITDSQSAGKPNRFYRARSGP